MNSLIEICSREIKVQGRLLRIARIEGDKHVFVDDPETLLAAMRDCRTRIDIFTFLQKLPKTSPQYAYPMEWDNLAVLKVSTFDQWWNHQIRSYPRNRARQAEKKGVVVREVPFNDALVKGIWEIYNESPVRQGRPFPHFGKDIQTVYREEATFLDSSVFIGAFLNDQLIGFVKLVADETRTQANMMNVLSLIQHRDKAPTNALVAHAVRACADRQIPYLVYQNFSYGRRAGDSLSHFKEINGFQRVDLPRYYVPLTPLGRAALRLRLHQRLTERLPVPVVEKLRNLRNAWYNRKYQSVAEVS